MPGAAAGCEQGPPRGWRGLTVRCLFWTIAVSGVALLGPGAGPITAAEPAWSFYGSALTYVVPDDQDYLQPSVQADRESLHLEARYNYEDLKTGSLWIGYNASTGDDPSLTFTPMLGCVFGEVSAIAPGYRGSLTWGMAGFETEGEFLIDGVASADSYFYSWSELTLAPLDWLTVGLVLQRTRAYASSRELQRGFLLGAELGPVVMTSYLFNPDDSEPTYVLALAAAW